MPAHERYPIDGSRDALWMATAVDAPTTHELGTTEHHCDVAIVGGGFTGLNAAMSLAKDGTSVCVLEANGLGFGASGRSGGQVNMGLNLGPEALIKRFGNDAGRRLIDTVTQVPDTVFASIRDNKLNCDPVQNGWVQAAINQHFFDQQISVQNEYEQYGCSMEILDKEQAAARTGSETFVGGLFNVRAGSLHPLSYTRELARVALENGATIFTHSRVQKLEQTNAGWIVHGENGKVHCGKVLICTNGYTDNLVKGLSKAVVPVRSILIASEPLSDNLRKTILPDQVTLVDKRSLILYFRYDRDGRLCIGDHGPMRDAFALGDFENLKKRVVKVFPQLSNTRWDFHWGGRVAMTKETIPFIEQLAPGLWAGMGYNGRGVGMGTALGMNLAKLANGLPESDSPFPVTKAKRFALHAMHKPGVYLNVKWFELNDYLRGR